MIKLLRVYLPSLVLTGWAMLVAVGVSGTLLTSLALALLAISVAVHTSEVMRHRHRRRPR